MPTGNGVSQRVSTFPIQMFHQPRARSLMVSVYGCLYTNDDFLLPIRASEPVKLSPGFKWLFVTELAPIVLLISRYLHLNCRRQRDPNVGRAIQVQVT